MTVPLRRLAIDEQLSPEETLALDRSLLHELESEAGRLSDHPASRCA